MIFILGRGGRCHRGLIVLTSHYFPSNKAHLTIVSELASSENIRFSFVIKTRNNKCQSA